jgi:hypothetical protein
MPEPTVVYDTYWKFAAERQKIFFARLNGKNPPWTNDPILEQHKFTNAYRASDRTSQYLIRHVIYAGLAINDEDTCFRILLFKLFNKIETWELLESVLGTVSWSAYRFEEYDTILTKALAEGRKIYSAAYIMPPGQNLFGMRFKHQTHLKLLERMMDEGIAHRLASSKNMEE